MKAAGCLVASLPLERSGDLSEVWFVHSLIHFILFFGCNIDSFC